MAYRGAKPKPTAFKVIQGNPGKRPLDGEINDIEMREEPLDPPVLLQGRQLELWTRFINPAWWLEPSDSPKAYMWCCLQQEFEQCPAEMTATRIGQLRALGSELGFDPTARTRMPGSNKKGKDPADKYF